MLFDLIKNYSQYINIKKHKRFHVSLPNLLVSAVGVVIDFLNNVIDNKILHLYIYLSDYVTLNCDIEFEIEFRLNY